MATAALNLPVDIPWDRVCVTEDMIDPGKGQPSQTPALWQSSMALYRYVPPEEYQLYPGRRLLYYKLAVSISNYQPKSEQVLGTLDTNALRTGTLADEEVKRRLAKSLPCSAAIVHFTVTPHEQNRDLSDYPYVMDVQPRQRALYESVTESNERASRSLETLQVRKDAGSSNSMEVLDIDQGGGIQAQFAGFGGGLTRSGQWGAKSLGKEDSSNVTTNDGSREARETQAFTTQLSQMYTLLQAYHLGTNRVFVYITPRPHTVEPPTGFSAPRALDGVQELFFVVSQDADDELPCVTARLDTGHLSVEAENDFDRSKPPQVLTVDCHAPAPLPGDTSATPTQIGSSAFYGCFYKTVTKQNELPAPTGCVVESWTDLQGTVTGNSNFTQSAGQPQISPDGRLVTLSATATGYRCFRNEGGDFFNFVLHPSGEATGTDLWSDTTGGQDGRVIKSVRVSFRSEVKNKKIGDRYVLALTTRQMHCCDKNDVVPTTMIEVVPVWFVPAVVETAQQPPIPDPGPERVVEAAQAPSMPATPVVNAPVMGLADVNALQQRLGEETARVSSQIEDVTKVTPRDGEFVLRSLIGAIVDDPRRQRALREDAETLDLSKGAVSRLGKALGREEEQPVSRYDVLSAPEESLRSATRGSAATVLRLRLEAAGLPTVKKEPEAKKEPETKGAAARRARSARRRKTV
jgi:hypothetical protein